MCKHTAVTEARKNFSRPAAAGGCEHYCAACRQWLSPTRFAPSRVRAGIRLCSVCAYKRTSTRTGQLPAVQRQLRLIARQLAVRERNRGIRPVNLLPLARLHQLLYGKFRLRSSATGRPLSLADATLCRADEARPFSDATNCALLSHTELRRRSRAAQQHGDD